MAQDRLKNCNEAVDISRKWDERRDCLENMILYPYSLFIFRHPPSSSVLPALPWVFILHLSWRIHRFCKEAMQKSLRFWFWAGPGTGTKNKGCQTKFSERINIIKSLIDSWFMMQCHSHFCSYFQILIVSPSFHPPPTTQYQPISTIFLLFHS